MLRIFFVKSIPFQFHMQPVDLAAHAVFYSLIDSSATGCLTAVTMPFCVCYSKDSYRFLRYCLEANTFHLIPFDC